MVNPIDWIKNGSDCEKCKWCWESCTSNENGTEWDCGCYIKGSDYDEKPCRLINPLKFIIGWKRKKKNDYYFSHEYDDFGEWFEKDQEKLNAMKEALKETFEGKVICHKCADNSFLEYNTEGILDGAAWEIRNKYDPVAHPIENKRLRQEWKELISKTWKRFTGIFKPYLCK